MTQTAKDKMTKARAGLILDHPFFGSLALRQVLVENNAIETLGTDSRQILYNPKFVDSLSLEETKGVIAHEVMHVACAHHARRGSRDLEKWNIAGDYAINPMLTDAGFRLPEGGLNDPAFRDMSAEEIYTKIPDPPKGGGGQGGGKKDGQGHGKCPPDPGRCGAVMDAPGEDGGPPTQAELAQAEQEAKIAVAQAAQQAKAMGRLPAGIERMLEDMLAPKLPWRELLRRFMDQAAKTDYSWVPPNRRFIHRGMYLPSFESEDLGEVAIAVDTSGSVSHEEVAQFAGEISAILEEFPGVQTTVIYCDADVAHVEEFSHDDLPVQLHPAGGGGTDFRPPFEWLDKHGRSPVALLYFTDMCCYSFPNPPPYPVMWIQTSDCNMGEPPFGEVIQII